MTDAQTQIAIVGDLHSSWDEKDVEDFNQRRYGALLMTGDLGSSGARDGVKVARSVAKVRTPVFVMLGNNDATDYARIAAEFTYQAGRAELLSQLDPQAIESGTSATTVCGFSAHPLTLSGRELTMIAARPFAMGGGELSSPTELAEAFDIHSWKGSRERLNHLVESAPTEHLIFLAHNGPSGLGDAASSPFGRDFHPNHGDWGDADLAEAINHAKGSGRNVLAVVAGHMHWPLRGGAERKWQVVKDGTLYLNAACVPRHRRQDDRTLRHHIALSLAPDGVVAEEVWQ